MWRSSEINHQTETMEPGQDYALETYDTRRIGTGNEAHSGEQPKWWHNSAKLLNGVLIIGYFDAPGLPRLS
jgi:hypothetical protein